MEAFYGKEIDPSIEQETIQKILAKYRRSPVNDELKKTIYNELCVAKRRGDITIPFKVVMRKYTRGKRCDYIEVILDTKV